ncbi:MAG TPA: amidohydrolase family protein, partial [Vicinamibacterales bacterium]
SDPIGGRWGRDRAGRLNGRAYEAAVVIVLRRVMAPDLTVNSEAQNLQRAAAVYARWGVTTVHHMGDELPLSSIRAALVRATLPIKWTVYGWGLPEATIGEAWHEVDSDRGTWPPRTRLSGLKWILDGSPFERGAFLLADYSDRPGWRGRSNYTEAQLREILAGALTSRHQLTVHAVGDGEIDMVLHLMAELAPAGRWRAVRVRIEHGEGLFGDGLARAAELGVVVDQQPIHLAAVTSEHGSSLPVARWGNRAVRFALLRSLLAAGVPLALSSDANGAEAAANPFLNLMIAVSYPRRPAEALTREQALTAYTTGGAYAEREEAQKGRIMRGMAADLAVLSQDVLIVPLGALPATTSLLTVVDGTVAYDSGRFAIRDRLR